MSIKYKVEKCILWKIRKGDISFWWDNWSGKGADNLVSNSWWENFFHSDVPLVWDRVTQYMYWWEVNGISENQSSCATAGPDTSIINKKNYQSINYASLSNY